jgi:hypothetical protein
MGKLNIFFTETIVFIEPKLYIDNYWMVPYNNFNYMFIRNPRRLPLQNKFYIGLYEKHIYHFSFSKFTIIFTFLQNECLLLSPKIQEGRYRSH